jgi:peptidyl-prolyl cis-trans isomerase-like protein 2
MAQQWLNDDIAYKIYYCLSETMVKRQKEKQYQSATENKRNSQLRKGISFLGGVVQRKLPFHCCALTLTPFTNPVCNSTGVVFENSALVNFLMKNNNKDPVTGKLLNSRDVIELHMDKDEEGRWQCPVVTKPFSDHTKIVAIVGKSRREAYVYSFEAYKELNVKTKNWVDLTTGERFSPKKGMCNIQLHCQTSIDLCTFYHSYFL